MAKFKHRIYSPWSERIYWGENSAADESTAIRVEVQVGPGCYNRSLEFAWPAEKFKVEKLERMLEVAYEAGRLYAKAEIREVLGVKETRQ